MTTPAKPRPAEEPRKCPRCGGNGWFRIGAQWVECQDCDTTGFVQNLHGEMTDEGSLPDE
jgi:DnaJ-class molecular chaperone